MKKTVIFLLANANALVLFVVAATVLIAVIKIRTVAACLRRYIKKGFVAGFVKSLFCDPNGAALGAVIAKSFRC